MTNTMRGKGCLPFYYLMYMKSIVYGKQILMFNILEWQGVLTYLRGTRLQINLSLDYYLHGARVYFTMETAARRNFRVINEINL